MCYQKVLQALSEFCYCQHNVQICDTSRPPTPRNPSDYVPVANEDCVILSQFLTKCGRSTPPYSKAVAAGLTPEGINLGETE
jgi:hypothetical protein